MKKILIADDDDTTVDMLKMIFDSQTFALFETREYKESLQAFNLHNPDLVILDLLFPKLDGLKILEFIRFESSFKNTPVIISSNFVTDEIKEIAREYNSDFVIKVETEPTFFLKRAKTLFTYS